jgi:hypothetical protein
MPGRRGGPAPAADTHEVPNLLKIYDITMGRKPQHQSYLPLEYLAATELICFAKLAAL